MLLQYPKLSGTSVVAHYNDYRKMHHHFIRIYKVLYEDVSGFAHLPQKFIEEAEPVIDRYLAKAAGENELPTQKTRMQIFTDFINRFYRFTDEATEMFTEHQALAEQTVEYMQKVSFLNEKNHGRNIRDCEDEYTQLMPELNRLNRELERVRQKVDAAENDLNHLKPLWDKLRDRIAA